MDEHGQGNGRRVQIRKYPNRRYYDTSRSRHVTLEEIYGLIRDGCEIEVVDSKSGEDITAKVLAQIIIELDPPKLGIFPVALLHRILRSNEQIVNDFVQKYFSQAFAAFLDSQRNAEQYMRQAMGMPSSAPTVSDWTKMMWGTISPSLWPQSQQPPPPSPQQGPSQPAGARPPSEVVKAASAPPTVSRPESPSNVPANDAEHGELHKVVADLRREINDLQSQLRPSRRGSGKPGAGRSGSRRKKAD